MPITKQNHTRHIDAHDRLTRIKSSLSALSALTSSDALQDKTSKMPVGDLSDLLHILEVYADLEEGS